MRWGLPQTQLGEDRGQLAVPTQTVVALLTLSPPPLRREGPAWDQSLRRRPPQQPWSGTRGGARPPGPSLRPQDVCGADLALISADGPDGLYVQGRAFFPLMWVIF